VWDEVFCTRPASYTMGVGSFPVVKRRKRDLNHPPHLSPRSKKEYNYTSTPFCFFMTGCRVNFAFTFTFTSTFTFTFISIIFTQFKLVIQATGGSPGLETWTNTDEGSI